MFVRDGDVWSSAGITAGIDLALAIVRDWFGHDLALEIARHLVVPLARNDMQLAFADQIGPDTEVPTEFASLFEFLASNCHRKLKIEDLSDATGMTQRTFHRRCKDALGVPPGKLLTNYRLDMARSMLINSSDPMKQIADRTGFASEFVLSHAFKKAFGMSPKAFREGLSAR
jgi:transcriptional regulator GlxA family with amidase domain